MKNKKRLINKFKIKLMNKNKMLFKIMMKFQMMIFLWKYN